MHASNTQLAVNPSQVSQYSEKDFNDWFRGLGVRGCIALRAAVMDGVEPGIIAAKLSVSLDFIVGFVAHRQWLEGEPTKESRARDKRLAALWETAVSAKTQLLAQQGLDMVSRSLERDDSKGFANAARGAAQMVQLARQSSGMDADDDSVLDGADMSVFYIPSPMRPEVNVTPAVGVAAEAAPELAQRKADVKADEDEDLY